MIKSVLWTQKERDTAIQMAKDGYTTREIGIRIGRSKNSVIGFLHRSQIYTKNFNPTGKPKVKAISTPKSAPRPRLAIVPKEATQTKIPNDIKWVKLFDATRTQCRFILEKPSNVFETKCCGKTTFYKSWCQEHFNRVYAPRGTAA